MTNFSEIESAIRQLPQTEVKQLIAHLQAYILDADKDQAQLITSSAQENDVRELDYDPDEIPVHEWVAQVSAQASDEEWKKLPTDLARRLKHYQGQRTSAEEK